MTAANRLANLEGWLAGAEFRLAELREPWRASKLLAEARSEGTAK